MKTPLFIITLTACFAVIARSEVVELKAGPDLHVTHDPAVWKLAEPLQKTAEGVAQAARWKLQRTEWAEITVASYRASKTESEYKDEIVDMQKFRGDPAELARERRESFAGRDWLILEFRNRHTRPARSEIHYFLSTDRGHASVFVISEEANLLKHREAIGTFLRALQVR